MVQLFEMKYLLPSLSQSSHKIQTTLAEQPETRSFCKLEEASNSVTAGPGSLLAPCIPQLLPLARLCTEG